MTIEEPKLYDESSLSFTVGGKRIQLGGVKLSWSHRDPPPAAGVTGFTTGTYNCTLSMKLALASIHENEQRVWVQCGILGCGCGVGRIYANRKRAEKALAGKWKRHVCSRGAR